MPKLEVTQPYQPDGKAADYSQWDRPGTPPPPQPVPSAPTTRCPYYALVDVTSPLCLPARELLKTLQDRR